MTELLRLKTFMDELIVLYLKGGPQSKQAPLELNLDLAAAGQSELYEMSPVQTVMSPLLTQTRGQSRLQQSTSPDNSS